MSTTAPCVRSDFFPAPTAESVQNSEIARHATRPTGGVCGPLGSSLRLPTTVHHATHLSPLSTAYHARTVRPQMALGSPIAASGCAQQPMHMRRENMRRAGREQPRQHRVDVENDPGRRG